MVIRNCNSELYEQLWKLNLKTNIVKKVSWKKEIGKNIGVQLKNALRLILYNTIIHQINKAVGSRHIAILSQHNKLDKLWKRQHKPKQQNEENLKGQIIRNYSSCFVT